MEFLDLVTTVQSLKSEDAFGARLDAHQWRALSRYLAMDQYKAGQCLMRQGERGRTVFFLGEGQLQMSVDESPLGPPRTELLRPGSMVGEAGLFGDEPHLATVEAMTPVIVWELRLPRFEELTQRLPSLALELMRGAGAVMAVRQRLQLARIAIHALSRQGSGNEHRSHAARSHAGQAHAHAPSEPISLAA